MFAVFFLTGCASMTGDTGDGKPKQGESTAQTSGTYSITNLYDGDAESKERAAKWMDAQARNMCASDYIRLSERSVPTMNQIGEVTFSRLTWEIRCMPRTE
ncbi:MAG: hypothetical protein KGM95_00250 [Betaproteobacteria bacterium]|nr:hypothetical protein [Betaproteobacteria bacterium]